MLISYLLLLFKKQLINKILPPLINLFSFLKYIPYIKKKEKKIKRHDIIVNVSSIIVIFFNFGYSLQYCPFKLVPAQLQTLLLMHFPLLHDFSHTGI